MKGFFCVHESSLTETYDRRISSGICVCIISFYIYSFVEQELLELFETNLCQERHHHPQPGPFLSSKCSLALYCYNSDIETLYSKCLE